MEKKKIAFCLIKILSEDEKVVFKQKIRCGKTAKNADRLEKLFVTFEKAIELNQLQYVDPIKLAKSLKLLNAKKLDPFYTELVDDLKSFLTLIESKSNAFQQLLSLQKALCNREEKEYIKDLHLEIRKKIASKTVLSPEDYYQQAIFYNNLYTHPSTNTQKGEALVYLKNSEIYLDTFYWIQKLRLLVEKANRGILLPEENYLLKELPSLPDLSQYTYNQNSHILSIYASVYQFALAPFQEEDLIPVINLMEQHSAAIPSEDKERISNYLITVISYCITTHKTNLSNKNIYQIHKLAFTNLWFVQDDGFIYFEDFINILGLAFSYKDSELLESIDDDYVPYMPLGYAPFISMLSKAYNFFLHKKWLVVLKTFSNQELPNLGHRMHFIMHRNTLMLKSLFEILIQDKVEPETEDISSFLEKHHRFTQRKSATFSDQARLRNAHFYKLLKQLYIYLSKRLEYNFDKKEAKKELQEWIREVEEMGNKTIESAWLLSKGQALLEELSNLSTTKASF